MSVGAVKVPARDVGDGHPGKRGLENQVRWTADQAARAAAPVGAVAAAADDVLDGIGITILDYRNISWWKQMGGR